jgi:uncharacterized membrane-anchored protein YhcB (DUF1043 family)
MDNIEQKVEKVMISKIQLIVSLAIVVSTIVGFFFKIQMDIALIKENHYTHIENLQRDMERINAEYQEKDKELKDTQVNLMKTIGENNAKLNQIMGKMGIK